MLSRTAHLLMLFEEEEKESGHEEERETESSCFNICTIKSLSLHLTTNLKGLNTLSSANPTWTQVKYKLSTEWHAGRSRGFGAEGAFKELLVDSQGQCHCTWTAEESLQRDKGNEAARLEQQK